MRKGIVCIASIALIIFHVPNANALTFDWSYSSGGGTLDAIDQGGGVFLVDSISGMANGLTITGLAAYGNQDQLLYLGNQQLDAQGLAFSAGGELFNLYSYGGVGGLVFSCGSSIYCLLGPGRDPVAYY